MGEAKKGASCGMGPDTGAVFKDLSKSPYIRYTKPHSNKSSSVSLSCHSYSTHPFQRALCLCVKSLILNYELDSTCK